MIGATVLCYGMKMEFLFGPVLNRMTTVLMLLLLRHWQCRDGLCMARYINTHKVWLETDSQKMLRLWQASPNQRSSIEAIMVEIRELSSVFEEFKFTYIARSCNEVAHTIAKQVAGDTRFGWSSCAPACVTHLMIRDCNSAPIE